MNHSTILQMFLSSTTTYNNRNMYYYKTKGRWEGISGTEVRITVKDLAFALNSLDIGKGCNVALLSNNSPRWAMADYGIICSGAASVSVYPTLIPSQIEYIINDSNSKVIFVENQEQLDKIKEIWENCPQLTHAIVLDNSDSSDDSRIFNFMQFLDIGTEFEKSSSNTFENLINIAKSEDLLTLIYTSGTTGNPKGVMLTHANMIGNIDGITKHIDYKDDDSLLSFLPLSHSFERMCGHFTAFAVGAKVYYAESIEKVPENLKEVQPTMVTSVPRLYEKIYSKIINGLKSAPKVRQNIFWWSYGVGKQQYEYMINGGATLPFLLGLKAKIADKLVFSKVRDRFGGKLRFFVSGGAPLSKEIAEFFAALGIKIIEGYGLTETSPILTANTPENQRLGSVGRRLYNVEIKIASDGEILAQGPNVMKGYYNNPEATKEAIDNDGWFHTGDIGHLDEDGYLYITDRKKNILVTSGGKNVAPAPIESALVNSQFIEQSIVLGDNKNFISALIVPAKDSVKQALLSQDKSLSEDEIMSNHVDVKALIQSEVDNAMEQFSNYERVKEFSILSREFTLESGELTPTLKVVRKVVLQNFSDEVEKIYS